MKEFVADFGHLIVTAVLVLILLGASTPLGERITGNIGDTVVDLSATADGFFDAVAKPGDTSNPGGSGGQEQEPVTLAAGLYDENDNLKISWDDLVSTNYKTIDYHKQEFDSDTENYYTVTANNSILYMSDKGLKTCVGVDPIEADSMTDNNMNYSSEFLQGKLIVSDSVTSIGHWCFAYCKEVTSITIPDSVTYIGVYAFMRSANLTEINYQGTVDNWKAIEKHSMWASYAPTITIHCTDADITINQ